MKNVIYFNTLYDIYSNLLTDKEKEVFLLYYEEDYSLQEIADLKKITRSAVGKMIKIIENKLENYENILNIYTNKQEIKKILNECKDNDFVKKISEILKIDV